MSNKIMDLCWPLKMPPTAKAVLVSLADNAKDTGECWPSISKISERTCFGRTAVIDAVAWLESAGALTADRSNGRHTSYMVTPENYAEPARETNRSGKQTGPSGVLQPVRLADDQSGRRTAPVREADTNHKEPSLKATGRSNPKTTRETAALDYSGWPSLPSDSILAEWLAVRKRKKAVPTQGVIDRMGAKLLEAGKLGYTVDECLTKAVDRNWQGFEPSWLEPKSRAGPLVNGKPSAAADFRNTTYTGTPYDELPPELR